MALQKGTFIEGTFENVIYYKMREKYYMRMKPSAVSQTEGTKRSAGLYGRASAFAKQLRISLQPIIPAPRSKALRNRLTPAVYAFLAEEEISHLNGFELHDLEVAGVRLELQPIIQYSDDGSLSLTLPSFNPKNYFPANSRTPDVQMSIMAAFLCKDSSENTATKVIHLMIPYEQELMTEQTIILANEVPQPCFIAVALRLQLMDKTRSVNYKETDLAWIAGCLKLDFSCPDMSLQS